ncbi:SpoIIE family protein phosphatase [Streptomyces sp. NBC_00057]|uniref:SpoIIE family protein phosphatase n=1 Tax=Streptomyces sp. NBC_00057 TaxID=2975634 RepID=UPI00324C645B
MKESGRTAARAGWLPGALLLLITDGVTEARNRTGTFYDPCASAVLTDARFMDPGGLVHAVTADVARWSGDGHQDDMSILAVARRGGHRLG